MKIIVPTTYLFGSPFLCPCEYVSVSCWVRHIPASIWHRKRGCCCYYCPLLTHKHKQTERHVHAQTAKDNRMRANDGHSRSRQSLFPQHICLGLLYCVPVSMCVSLVGNAASRRAFANENRVIVIIGCPLLTHEHKQTQTHMHAQTAKDNRTRANDGHARAHQSLFPQHICLGLLFCVPASMSVSLVGNAIYRQAFATENGVIIVVIPF